MLTGAALAGAWPLLASSEEISADDTSLATPASRRATANALEWLDRHQRADGAWHCDVGFKLKVGEVGLAEPDAEKSPFGYHIIKRLK